jgi:hypothetical protein
MSERSVLRFKSASRLEWRSQDGQDEPEQCEHRAQAKRFSRRSTRIIFSVHTGLPIGSQFAARMGAEATLLALAYELEAARPWANRRPPNLAS